MAGEGGRTCQQECSQTTSVGWMNYKLMHDSIWINIFNGTLCIWSSVSVHSVVQLRYQKAALFLWSNQTFIHVIFFFSMRKRQSATNLRLLLSCTVAVGQRCCTCTVALQLRCQKKKAGLPSRKQLYYFEYVCETDVGCVVVCFFKHCRYDCLKSCETSLRVLEKHIHFRQVLVEHEMCLKSHEPVPDT